MVNERTGHATPEFRTLAIRVPHEAAGLSPEVLAASIAAYAQRSTPTALMFAFDALAAGPDGEPASVLIAEARDAGGCRLFWRQCFRCDAGGTRWEQPQGGDWIDPGEEEMILDRAFRAVEEPVAGSA